MRQCNPDWLTEGARRPRVRRPLRFFGLRLVVEIWITFEKSSREKVERRWPAELRLRITVWRLKRLLFLKVWRTLLQLFISFTVLLQPCSPLSLIVLVCFFCRCLSLSLFLSHSFCLHYRPPTACTPLLFILTSYPLALRMLIPRTLPRSVCANEHRW